MDFTWSRVRQSAKRFRSLTTIARPSLATTTGTNLVPEARHCRRSDPIESAGDGGDVHLTRAEERDRALVPRGADRHPDGGVPAMESVGGAIQ